MSYQLNVDLNGRRNVAIAGNLKFYATWESKKDKLFYFRESEWECLDKTCIAEIKLCDGQIDCSDGQDESLEQCFESCDPELQFQCGNGKCIDKEKVCDNAIDCLDSADEVPIVCEDIKGYIPNNSYRNCTIPKDRKYLAFADKTIPHFTNDVRYMLPNEPALFICLHGRQLIGKEWNVCQLNGNWHHDLPICQQKIYT